MALPIPSPTVQFCDVKTGLISRPWYEYFKDKDRVTSGVGGGSSNSVWFYGTAAPSNSLGLEGDFYMLLSGGAIGGVRVKQGGVWV